MKDYQNNKAYAEKLSSLMTNHPDYRVIAWIDTDGIDDSYGYMSGSLYEPCIETIVVGKDDMYHMKEDSPYDDCGNYYGWKEVDEWTDEEIEEKAKAIPWEDVISIRVSAM